MNAPCTAISAAPTIEISDGISSASFNGLPGGILCEDLPVMQRQLLAWYSHAKRDLEWRRTRDPYCIWLSEIMLQQTRVAAVIPYYRRFLARFPTVQHLANARIDSVLRYWSGLGYYSRARNLHQAAKQIVARHNGKFPQDPAEALELAGIGSYTAAAVLSISYHAPLAVLDGNVARVLARLTAVRDDLRQPAVWRGLTDAAQTLLHTAAPGDWNQAMMELGATLCTPRAPHCAECPISRWCRARALGIAESVPAPRRKPATVHIVLAAAVLLDRRGRTLLVRYPQLKRPGRRRGEHAHDHQHDENSPSLFSRLWQFPSLAGPMPENVAPRRPAMSKKPTARTTATTRAGDAARNAPSKRRPPVFQPESGGLADLARRLSAHLAHSFGISPPQLTALPTSQHGVTFRNIRLAPFLARVDQLPSLAGARTPHLAKVERLPISNATRKIIATVRQSLENPGIASCTLPVSRRRRRAAKKPR